MSVTEVTQVAAAVLIAVGGAGFVLLALSSWLAKVWAARILEADRLKYQSELERIKSELDARNQELKGDIDKTIHVHRLHFETEFRSLRGIWRKLAKMRRDMSSLRPMFSIGVPPPTKEAELEQLQEKFTVFVKAFDAAINAVDDNRPFLTEDLHTKLSAALRTAHAEYFDIRVRARRKDEDPDWFEKGAKNYEALDSHVNEIANLIRTRLRVLAVYPE